MRAVRFANKRVEIIEAPHPDQSPGAPQSPDDVLVRVRACGICGSDMTILDLGFPIAGIPGHEIGGELEDGTPVAIEPFIPCRGCDACADGDYQVCGPAVQSIYGIARDGGMAEFVRVPRRCLVPLPRNVDARSACLVEPLAVAVHGVRRSGIQAGRRALVVGGGTIGLTTAIALRAQGVEADLAARHPAQTAAAKAFGAEVLTDDPADTSKTGSPGQGADYDVVFDCAGTPSAGVAACEALKPRGLFMMMAPAWGDTVLPGMTLAQKELEIRVSMMYGAAGDQRDVDTAARLLGEDDQIAATLISHRFPLDAAPDAFEKARDRRGGALKVVLEP